MKLNIKFLTVLLSGLVLVNSCKKKPSSVNIGAKSTVTGIAYNKKDGGFKTAKSFKGQKGGPNMVFIEGGRFTMGALEEDVLNSRDNKKRTVSVQSFYMDETEIANVHYLEYLYSVQKDSTQEAYEQALPDTLVWKNELAYNDSYIEQYFRHPGFRMYPVVGVSWVQANNFCLWRSQAVNNALAEEGKKSSKSEGKASSGGKKTAKDAKNPKAKSGETAVKTSEKTFVRPAIESGKVLPSFRLPSEAEWEYAAKAMIGTQDIDENQSEQRIYPWSGPTMRNPKKGKNQGQMLANFKRGRGDYAGIAGKSNDGAIITQEVYSYKPNDFGLYNMAGNVSEWTYDLYRPLSFEDFSDLNPLRRNDFLDSEKDYDRKGNNSLIDNKSRVYKGGSWADIAYWLAPGTRRFIDQDSATSTIGFRCAMIRAGSNK